MYIVCVCFFSALSRRVGALQMSIIIIIIKLPALTTVRDFYSVGLIALRAVRLVCG